MKYRKATNAKGQLDSYAIRAEEYASFLTRRNRPPQVTLERIANLAEKAIEYQHTYTSRGKVLLDNRPSLSEQQERQRAKVLDRIWEAYRIVQEAEILHPAESGKDESWNNAKQDSETKRWVSDPVYFYGDHFEYVVGDELYGNKAQGKTPIRGSNENLTQGDDE